MHPRRTILALAICLCGTLVCSSLRAQLTEEETINRLKTRVSTFFQNLNNAEVNAEKAFADFLVNGPLEKREEIKGLADKAAALPAMYGDFIEFESIGAKAVGKDLVLLKYLYKMKKYPVVWYFIYYRPPSPSGNDNDWVVISVRFDNRLDLLDLTHDKSN